MIIYFSILIVLSIALLLINYILAKSNSRDIEKLSNFECGFNSYNSPSEIINVRYFIICVLYLLFDLEISFLFPMLFLSNQVIYSYFDFYFILLFIGILFLGLYFELTTNIINTLTSH